MNTAVLTATEFKATCLQVFARLAVRQLDRVEVTKRGKSSPSSRPRRPIPTGTARDLGAALVTRAPRLLAYAAQGHVEALAC